MNPTVALPDLDTANNLRPGVAAIEAFGRVLGRVPPVRPMPPRWPGLPVDTLPTIQTHTTDDFVEYGTERPVRAGDRVTFTMPCPSCRPDGSEFGACARCESTSVVPVFSAVIDPVPVGSRLNPSTEGDRHQSIHAERCDHHPRTMACRCWCHGIDHHQNGWLRRDALPADLPFTESTRFVLMIDSDTIEDA